MQKVQKYFKRTECITILTAFIFGFFVHLFSLVNTLHNCDDIYFQPNGVGATLSSGRWLLAIFKEVFKPYTFNLPWVNGILFILFVSISAGIITNIFNIKSRKFAILIGMITVSFPSVTSTLFYRFTSIYYGLSLLFAVLSVWSLLKCRFGILLSIIFTTLSLGIYQAYLSFIASLMVLTLIKISIEKFNFKKLIYKSFYFLGTLILGTLLYYLCLKFFLLIFNHQLSGYKGISELGQLNIYEIPKLTLTAFMTMIQLPFKDYCSLAQTTLIKISYFVLIATSVIMLLLHFRDNKKILNIITTIFLCLILIVSVGSVMIICLGSNVYTLMLYGVLAFLFAPLVYFETIFVKDTLNIAKKRTSCVIIVALLAVVFSFSYAANVNYSAMYYANRQVENHITSIVTQVHMTEGFDTSKKWVFIGDYNNELFENEWSNQNTFGGFSSSESLINTYSIHKWYENYYGYSIPLASEEERDELLKQDYVATMPEWPNEGSIKIFDDYIVINQ